MFFFFKHEVHDCCRFFTRHCGEFNPRILLEFWCSMAPVQMHLMHKGPGNLGVAATCFRWSCCEARLWGFSCSPCSLLWSCWCVGVLRCQLIWLGLSCLRFWCLRLDVMFQLRVPFSDSWQRILLRWNCDGTLPNDLAIWGGFVDPEQRRPATPEYLGYLNTERIYLERVPNLELRKKFNSPCCSRRQMLKKSLRVKLLSI